MPVKSESFVLDVCPNCKGIWFDSGELAGYAEALAAKKEITPRKTKFFQHKIVQPLSKITEKTRFCPKCESKLTKFNYAYDSGIILDKCAACGGVWTDRGEAVQIAEYLKEDPKADELGRALAEITEMPEEYYSEGINPFKFFLSRLFIPFSDDVERQRFPIVTVSIIVFYLLFFLAQLILGPPLRERISEYFAKEDLFNGELLGSMIFSGGPLGLLLNTLFLWVFGDNVEDRFSRFGYLVFYLCCGIVAAVIYHFFRTNVSASAIGMIGAVSGVMGAYIVFYPAANIRLWAVCWVVELPALVYLGGWFIIQIIYGFYEPKITTAGFCIANVAAFSLGALVAFVKKIKNPSEEQV
jgi:membrane associated rhomboid family serine protease/Zn-finger nucleic acid-binding protein